MAASLWRLLPKGCAVRCPAPAFYHQQQTQQSAWKGFLFILEERQHNRLQRK